MKEILLPLAVIFMLCNSFLFAKGYELSDETDSVYYYCKNDKIYLPLNKEHFAVYFDLNDISKKDIAKRYNIYKDFSVAKDNIACFEIIIENTNYDSVFAELFSKPYIVDVEPVIGLEKTTIATRRFFVKTNKTNIVTLYKINQMNNVDLVDCLGDRYVLQVSKKSILNAWELCKKYMTYDIIEETEPIFNLQIEYGN